MWDLQQIKRVTIGVLHSGDWLMYMAAKVALMNYTDYGPLTPKQVEAMKQSWGE